MTSIDQEDGATEASSRPPRRRRRRSYPVLAPGVRLLGEFEGSGFLEPQHLARTSEGTMVQLSELLFFVAQEADGSTPLDVIAERVSRRYGKEVPAHVVEHLLDEHLRPLGIVARRDGTVAEARAVDPLLALRVRTRVVNESRVAAVARPFRALFWPPLVVAFVVAFVAVDVWLFVVHGLGASLRETMSRPGVFLLVFTLAFGSAAFHEIGHAAACLYGGARPGEMGVGFYLVWPAFYTDVTDAYRLGRAGRLRTDLGGIYFNAIFAVVVAAVYAATGYEPLLLVVAAQQFQMLQQLLPFVRLDGYYIVSDLTGVPDLFTRLRSIVRSIVPGREPDEKVQQLKPRARTIVAAWVVATVGFLALALGRLAFTMPDLYATSFSSARTHLDAARRGLDQGALASSAASSLQAATVLLAPAGISFVLARSVRSACTRPLARVRSALAGRRRSGPTQAPTGPYGGGRRVPSVRLDRRERNALRRSMQHACATATERRRARAILLAAAGLTDAEIATELGAGRRTVARWRRRFERARRDTSIHRQQPGTTAAPRAA